MCPFLKPKAPQQLLPAAAAPVKNKIESGADVRNSDVVAATTGREASGRVKLGKGSTRKNGAAVGLTI